MAADPPPLTLVGYLRRTRDDVAALIDRLVARGECEAAAEARVCLADLNADIARRLQENADGH